MRAGPLGSRAKWAVIAIAVAAFLLLAYEEWGGPDAGRPGGGPGGGSVAGQDGSALAPGETVIADVVRVVDGDTVVINLEGAEDRVRYIGIDTPESVQPGQPVECFGMESARRNEALVGGRTVALQIGAEPRDRYGRLLAYVRLGNLMVNAELLRGGFARTLTIPPNDRYAGEFGSLEEAARGEQVGLWDRCG